VSEQPGEREVRSSLDRLTRRAVWVAVGASALLAVGFLTDREQFLRSYLVAWLYCLAPALGGLALIMLHNLTGGAWGFAIRRLLEAAMRTLPLMALLFLPILVGGVHDLYEWSRADAVANDLILQHKAPYLNRGFFTVRALAYFAIWIFLAFAMLRLQARYDRHLDVKALRRMKMVSGVGLAVYVLTMSFASFDWAMSLEPHWFSTMFGPWFFMGAFWGGTTVTGLWSMHLRTKYKDVSHVIWLQKRHDLGKRTLAFNVFWGYLFFTQYIVIWYAKLPWEQA